MHASAEGMRHIAFLLALFASLSVAACGGAPDDTAHFGLKVVIAPAGEAPSSWCSGKGSSIGGGGVSPIASGLALDSASSNDGGTIYDVTLRGATGTGTWRYDESMARAGTTVLGTMQDGARTITVTLTGTFGDPGACSP